MDNKLSQRGAVKEQFVRAHEAGHTIYAIYFEDIMPFSFQQAYVNQSACYGSERAAAGETIIIPNSQASLDHALCGRTANAFFSFLMAGTAAEEVVFDGTSLGLAQNDIQKLKGYLYRQDPTASDIIIESKVRHYKEIAIQFLNQHKDALLALKQELGRTNQISRDEAIKTLSPYRENLPPIAPSLAISQHSYG